MYGRGGFGEGAYDVARFGGPAGVEHDHGLAAASEEVVGSGATDLAGSHGDRSGGGGREGSGRKEEGGEEEVHGDGFRTEAAESGEVR